MADLKLGDSTVSIGEFTNITDRNGYDNQPYFLQDGSIYYVSVRDEQADIYKYDALSGKITRITHTPEDEYSPMITPDGEYISVVRVEKDSTQRLWKFPINGDEPQVILPNITGIGYYAWVDENWLALYMIGDTSALQIADIRQGKGFIGSTHIGRSLHGKVSDYLAFNNEDGGIYISSYADKESVQPLMEPQRFLSLPEGTKDFAITPTGVFIASDGSKIMKFDIKHDVKWVEVADLAGTRAENFYRIAISPDGTRIAIVVYSGEKP